MRRRHMLALASLLAKIEDPSARDEAVTDVIIRHRADGKRFGADGFRALVDSARAAIVADRVTSMARASRAA